MVNNILSNKKINSDKMTATNLVVFVKTLVVMIFIAR